MRKSVLLLFLSCMWIGLRAQSDIYKRYIAQYSDMAVDQMNRYGVPASITLAQGLLESAAGTSRLATKGNNHFGIKCGGVWNGPYMLMTDDAPNEKFRVYRSVSESYEDHSKFLKNGRRYASLFELKRSDYKGWAHGLKKAGYATSPTYAHSLIELIERYDLYDYDKERHHRDNDTPKGNEATQRAVLNGRQVRRCNGQYYVMAHRGDTYASLAEMLNAKEKKLRTYNDADSRSELREGDIVYLGKKAKKADKKMTMKIHVMQQGESLYSISQRYGIRLASLCKMNPINRSYRFKAGDRIRIK